MLGGVLLANSGTQPPPPAVMRVPGDPAGLLAAGGRLWVSSQRTGSVWVLDAESGRPVRPPLRTGGTPGRLALGLGGAWVADTARGELIPVQLHPERVFPAVALGSDVSDVALAARAVWVASWADRSVRILEPGGAMRTLRVGAGPVALDADALRVVVAEADAGAIAVIDARTRRIAGRPVRVGGTPADVAVAGDVAWVVDASGGRLLRVDLRRERLDGPAVAVGRRPVGVAASGSDVYVLSAGDRRLVGVDANTGKVRSRRPVGAGPSAIALDSRYVWVANAGEDTVMRFDR